MIRSRRMRKRNRIRRGINMKRRRIMGRLLSRKNMGKTRNMINIGRSNGRRWSMIRKRSMERRKNKLPL